MMLNKTIPNSIQQWNFVCRVGSAHDRGHISQGLCFGGVHYKEKNPRSLENHPTSLEYLQIYHTDRFAYIFQWRGTIAKDSYLS